MINDVPAETITVTPIGGKCGFLPRSARDTQGACVARRMGGIANCPRESRELIPEHADSTSGLRLDAVWADIARRPYEYLVRRWNWKAGVLSGMLRGAIFFATNLPAGRDAAVGATLTEFGYRILFSGGIGSVTEALRKCEPAWAAALTASVALPFLGHLVEFMVHFLRGTPRIGTSVAVSIAFSVLSTLFNLYVMRRGVLVVGGERRNFIEDLAALPRLFAGFLAAGPLALWRRLRRNS